MTTSAKPLRADARRNRDRLLEVARASFVAHGVDGSLEEIAREAGVGVGTLYRHFPTREDLVRAVMGESFDTLLDRADGLLEADDPGAAVEEFLFAFAEHAGTYRGVPACVKGAVETGGNELAVVCTVAHSRWGTLFARAQAAGTLRADADATDVLRLVYGAVWSTDGQPSARAHTERMLRLVLDGLQSPARAAAA